MMILLVLGLMMVSTSMFLLGCGFENGRIAKLNRKEEISKRRNNLKASGLTSIPYGHVESLEVNFANDEFGDKEYKLASLIITSPSGSRFVVDTDLRSGNGSPMNLSSFIHNPAASVNSYLSNIGVIDVISNHVAFETSTDIERYYAFQKTVDSIYRGKHWLKKEDIASIEIRFFNLSYAELRTIAEPESSIFYYDKVKSKTNLTKTEMLFRTVENTLAIAEASLVRCDEMVTIGVKIVEDIIDDTINSIKMLAATQNESMLSYAYVAATVHDDEYISEEEWKDIKIFTTENNAPKNTSVTMDKIESVVNAAKSYHKKKGLDIGYEIAMDMIGSDEFNVYKHNRKSKQDRRSKKQKRKQNKHYDI